MGDWPVAFPSMQRLGRTPFSSRSLALMWAALVVVASSCDETPTAEEAPRALMDFTGAHGFLGAPFPSEHLRGADGVVDVTAAGNPLRVALADQITAALEGETGFGTTSAIHFALTRDLDASLLPDAFTSTEDGAHVALVDVEPGSPTRGQRAPFNAYFQADGGPNGAPNLLTLVPVQGIPLRADTMYAAVLLSGLRTRTGEPLRPSPELEALDAGVAIEGLSEDALVSYRSAWSALPELGIAHDDVRALAVFRTGDPTRVMARAVEVARASEALELTAPFTLSTTDAYAGYCVFHTTVSVPVYQAGEPPYLDEGGAWPLDETGAPALQRREEANVWLTLPRAAMPEAGFPAVALVRTGAGGNRPLVDRGPRLAPGAPDVPGTGPAEELARVGFAGISVDGPHGGLRNVTGGDEQFLVFNIQNPAALRDNLRQSALELVLLADLLGELRIDPTGCDGLSVADGEARIDTSTLAIMGHSMGASIAPIAAAFEPRYRALILSGAGASWIENVLYKESPIAVRPTAEALIRYTGRFSLTAADPLLNRLQWAGEAADAQVYARLLVDEPSVGSARHVLMFQGVVDTYIPPPIANALTLSLAIDHAGPALDREQGDFEAIDDLLPLRGRSAITLPAEGNVSGEDGAVTAVVMQLAEDGIEDGHEVMWQRADARRTYGCFLRTLHMRGMPRATDGASVDPQCE